MSLIRGQLYIETQLRSLFIMNCKDIFEGAGRGGAEGGGKFFFPNEQISGAFYHSLASLILEKLSDGKLTWSESVLIAEFYYKNKIEKK